MIFTDSLHGYGVGYNGAFLRYIPPPVGVTEYFKYEGAIVSIFPNPADDIIHVEISMEDNGSSFPKSFVFTLYDPLGRQVISHDLVTSKHREQKIEVNVSGLPAGLYFGDLSVGGRTISVNKICLR